MNELEQIVKILKEMVSDPWLMLSAIASFVVALVAIYVAEKNSFHNLFFKPKITIDKKIYNFKQNNLLISRLKIINSGKVIAKNATFIVEKLFYKDGLEWGEAKNFVGFPLSWMHYNKENTDLYRERPYYLDLCQIVNQSPLPIIYLCSPVGSPRLHGLDDLDRGNPNKIQLTLYCDNKEKNIYNIEIFWTGKFESPKIKFVG